MPTRLEASERGNTMHYLDDYITIQRAELLFLVLGHLGLGWMLGLALFS